MNSTIKKTLQTLLVITLLGSLSGCDDPQVYGSIGVSSFHGSGWSGGGMHTSISVGGRIR